MLFPDRTIELNNCLHIYNQSKDYEDLFVFIACIRTMLGTVTDFGHIRVVKKVVFSIYVRFQLYFILGRRLGKGQLDNEWSVERNERFHDSRMEE